MPLVDELLGACPDEATRTAIATVLKRYKGRRIYIPLRESGQQRRRRIAVETLQAAGFGRADAVRALMVRFNISRSSAYRLVSILGNAWHN